MKPLFTSLLLMVTAALPLRAGIDGCIRDALSSKGIVASQQADPSTLVRRYYLVVTDRIPTPAQTRAFLKNPDRTALVDSLLASDGFVEKQVLKWGDLLRIKSEFPSCMWPNAVQAFNKWLTEQFRANVPYNEFVSSLLLCSGSNFRVPQTNFYRAGNDRTPHKFASDAALLFLGRRSAPASWEPFFSQVKFKGTKEWKEEILYIDIDVPAPRYSARLGGKVISLEPGEDFRIPFAGWLSAPDNRELARCYANRLWSWLMGKGIIDPVDDLKEGAEPSNKALLDYLADSFMASGFNVRALAREILLSDAFATSTISNDSNRGDVTLFSHYLHTRLGAEQICDAICDVTEVPDQYSSRAPEPFTNFPAGTRANQVCDGTITTSQLDIFGRPSRDVALESSRDNSVNSKQILFLLNSSAVQDKLRRSPYLDRMASCEDVKALAADIYIRVLSREATPAELDAVDAWASRIRGDGRVRRIGESLIWALINTDEFLFQN